MISAEDLRSPVVVGKVSSKHGEFVIQDKNRSSAIKMYTSHMNPLKRKGESVCSLILCVCFFFFFTV